MPPFQLDARYAGNFPRAENPTRELSRSYAFVKSDLGRDGSLPGTLSHGKEANKKITTVRNSSDLDNLKEEQQLDPSLVK